MIRSKTFRQISEENLDKEVEEWSRNNPNIKILASGYSLSERMVNGLNILYDDNPKPEFTDEIIYKDDFIFRVLMACYSANDTVDDGGIKINSEDMKKLRWHISRQCPNFQREHHICDAARCDKDCSYFASYLNQMKNVKGGN